MSDTIRPLPHAGPRGPEDVEIAPNSESRHFEAARKAGLKPRNDRVDPLPPVYETCPNCRAEAPEARAYTHHENGYDILVQVGCMKCISGMIRGGE
jgi:hypothetical protein